MNDINWKTINSGNVEVLRSIPCQYCQAIGQLGLWDKLIATFYEESYAEFSKEILLKQKVRKNMLKNMEEEKIIKLLDTVNPVIRRHLLNILIEQADECPISIKVGQNLLNNMNKHLWSLENANEIFSLQPMDIIKMTLCARIDQKLLEKKKSPIIIWKNLTDPSNSFKNITNKFKDDYSYDSSLNSLSYISSSYFADIRYIKKRKSFGKMIADLYIEALDSFNTYYEANKRVIYCDFVLKPFYDLFTVFKDTWKQNSDVYKRVNKALINFPVQKFALNSTVKNMILDVEIDSFVFGYRFLMKHKMLTNDDIVLNILPKALHDVFDSISADDNSSTVSNSSTTGIAITTIFSAFVKESRLFLDSICDIILYYGNYSQESRNFIRTLYAISIEDKEHPLSFFWPKLIEYIEEKYWIDHLEKGNYLFLSGITKKLYYFLNNESSIDSLTKYPNNSTDFPFLFSCDFMLKLLNKVITYTINNKAKIIKESSPSKYTKQIAAIFSALVYPFSSSWKNDNSLSISIFRTSFYMISGELRDRILTELMIDPLTGKFVSSEFNGNDATPTTFLSLCLVFEDFKMLTKMLKSLKKNSKSKDETSNTNKENNTNENNNKDDDNKEEEEEENVINEIIEENNNNNNTDIFEEYGFMKNISINFPPSLTQKTRRVEEYKGTIHIFERNIIPLLRHKSYEISQNAYRLYINFVKKLMYFAISFDNPHFYNLTCETHFRLCRFLNSNVQVNVIPDFIRNVISPLSLYVGIRSHEDYATFLYDNILIKFPFSTDSISLTMLPIIHNLLIASNVEKQQTTKLENENSEDKDNFRFKAFERLSQIGPICADLTNKLVNKLFNEIPAGFNQSIKMENYEFDMSIPLPPSKEKIESMKNLINEVSKITISPQLCKRVLKNVFSKKNKINFIIGGEYINYSDSISKLLNNFDFYLRKYSDFYNVSFIPDKEPFFALLDILNEKIKAYNPDNLNHPTTTLIKVLINELKISKLFSDRSILLMIPDNCLKMIVESKTNIKSNQNRNNLSQFTTKLDSFNRTYEIRKETIELIKHFYKENNNDYDSFFEDLINDKKFNYDTIESVLSFVPLTKEQAKIYKNSPEIEELEKKRRKIVLRLNISYIHDKSIVMLLKKIDEKPEEKPKVCKQCKQKLNSNNSDNNSRNNHYTNYNNSQRGYNNSNRNTNISKARHEEWTDFLSLEIVKQILNIDSNMFCNIMKNDGKSLFDYVSMLLTHLKRNTLYKINSKDDTNNDSNNNLNFSLVAKLLDLCFKDILIEDLEPTPENPNPKPTPTMFSDDKGTVIATLEPFKSKKRKGQAKKSASGKAKTSGNIKFMSTKVLISYLSKILSLPITINNVDLSIFSNSMLEILSMSPSDIKKVIGDDNYSYYVDYLTYCLLRHMSFGKEIKDSDWSKDNFSDRPLMECFFRLFTCDATHHIALEIVNKKLQSFSNDEDKNSIVSAFVSVLTNNSLPFTLHTRTRTCAWCVDSRYVGFPIPKYCIEFIDRLSDDEKLHIDVRKTIAAGSVAYFMSQAIVNGEPTQFDELFNILMKLYNKSKNLMAPIFCQLVRPKFCLKLASTSKIYESMMPSKSRPEELLTPFSTFSNISMPHEGVWKEKQEKFVSTFIAALLLSKDDNVLQLGIQVLTKMYIRGGETASKIAPFIIAVFNDFNILRLSSNLINFIFNFCLQAPHQKFEGLADGFISIFTKIRSSLDEINKKQLQLFWTHDNSFKSYSYDNIQKICKIFTANFENVITNLKEKEDLETTLIISKKIVNALDGKEPISIELEEFTLLRNLFFFTANDDLINALIMTNCNNECNEQCLGHLLKFLKSTALMMNDKMHHPNFIINAFKKNKNSLSIKLIKEELINWELEICKNKNVKNIIIPLLVHFGKSLSNVSNNNEDKENVNICEKEEFFQLLPSLWKLGSIDQFNSYNNFDIEVENDNLNKQEPHYRGRGGRGRGGRGRGGRGRGRQ